jgi:hypothetical protein
MAWKSYTEQYFDSCGISRGIVISIAATLAKQERLKISERTITALDCARKQAGLAAVRSWCRTGTEYGVCETRARVCAKWPTLWG